MQVTLNQSQAIVIRDALASERAEYLRHGRPEDGTRAAQVLRDIEDMHTMFRRLTRLSVS